jgi:hypothetical protein
MAEQHSAHGQTAKHRTASGVDAGVADAIQPARRRRDHCRAEKGGRSPSELVPKQIEPQRARSPGRRPVAMAMNGGETDESPWSDGSAWGDEAIAPHGDGTARRSSPESGDKVAGDSKSLERGTG